MQRAEHDDGKMKGLRRFIFEVTLRDKLAKSSCLVLSSSFHRLLEILDAA